MLVQSAAPLYERHRSYARRIPENTVLYGVVSDQLTTFLAHAKQGGRSVPPFVERELVRYLECGMLAHGFVRVRCVQCKHERLVAFSCKGRGFCPSCGGRRMADTAAFLVDRVLPKVPVRQWVLSLPIALRYKLAYDSQLAAAVLQLFVRSVFASLRQRARARYGRASYECGSITFVQRFGDALNLNLHFHAIVLDGAYARMPGGKVRFRRLPPPTNAEVEQTTRRIVRRLRRLLIRHGLTPYDDPTAADSLPSDQPLLADIYAASVRSRIAMGDRAGVTPLCGRSRAGDAARSRERSAGIRLWGRRNRDLTGRQDPRRDGSDRPRLRQQQQRRGRRRASASGERSSAQLLDAALRRGHTELPNDREK